MNVVIGNVPFSSNSYHRYQNINNKITGTFTLSNARMIKNNTILVNTVDNTYDRVVNSNYGYYNVGGKNYYFFITGTNYINDSSLEISIEIDYFSTDFNNITLALSNVVRMHPPAMSSDYPNTNENFELPNKKFTQMHQVRFQKGVVKYVIAVNRQIPIDERSLAWIDEFLLSDYNPRLFPPIPEPTEFPNEISGNTYYVLDTPEECTNVLSYAMMYGYNDSVTGIWSVPEFCYIDGAQSTNLINHSVKSYKWYPTALSSTPVTFLVDTINSTKDFTTLASWNISRDDIIADIGLVTQYKKCKSPQFISWGMTSGEGMVELSPNTQNLSFKVVCDNRPELNVTCGAIGIDGKNFIDESCSLTKSVSNGGSLTADNTSREIRDGRKKVLLSVASGFAGYALGGLVGGVDKVDTSDELINAFKITPELISNFKNVGRKTINMQGYNGGNMIKSNDNVSGFKVGYIAPSLSDFAYLDKYFSRYGYLYNDVRIPNLRETYTYISGDIDFTGSISDVSRNYIKNLFAGGLTIWNITGMYSYDV